MVTAANPQKVITLSKAEVEALKDFCDDNLAVGSVNIIQESDGGVGWITKVQVQNLPETLTDITDTTTW